MRDNSERDAKVSETIRAGASWVGTADVLLEPRVRIRSAGTLDAAVEPNETSPRMNQLPVCDASVRRALTSKF